MEPANEQQVAEAYVQWCKHHYYSKIGKPHFDSQGVETLRQAREAQFLSAEDVAKKLGVTTTAYAKLERTECLGKVNLGTLKKAAAALNCELVYSIKLKTKQRFSEQIWRQVVDKANSGFWVKSRPIPLKVKALASSAQQLINNPKFRRERGWSRKK